MKYFEDGPINSDLINWTNSFWIPKSILTYIRTEQSWYLNF